MNEIIGKLGYIKIKNLLLCKRQVKGMRGQPYIGEYSWKRPI